MGSSNIPRYKCHKEVAALKIADINTTVDEDGCTEMECENGFKVLVSSDYMEKHKPHIGGYWVSYDGGYESFSPAKAFEEGYALIES